MSAGVRQPGLDLHLDKRIHASRFGVGLFPVHLPLLGESQLLSFPALSDMLKFSA